MRVEPLERGGLKFRLRPRVIVPSLPFFFSPLNSFNFFSPIFAFEFLILILAKFFVKHPLFIGNIMNLEVVPGIDGCRPMALFI